MSTRTKTAREYVAQVVKDGDILSEERFGEFGPAADRLVRALRAEPWFVRVNSDGYAELRARTSLVGADLREGEAPEGHVVTLDGVRYEYRIR